MGDDRREGATGKGPSTSGEGDAVTLPAPEQRRPALERVTTDFGERFEILRQLGTGGFGSVYEAADRKERRRVAIKVLQHDDAEALYRFKREFRSLAEVTHRNLVALYELVEQRGSWLLVMELVQGHRIDVFVEGCPEKLTSTFGQLALGLQALHEAGKLHRDLKPSNVLVEDDGRVVVLDFGLIHELADEPGRVVTGTPHYMSPEQGVSERSLDEASDWYAFGVMLYQALAGRLPHEGPPLKVLLAKQSEPPPPIAREAPEDLVALCMGLLALDPATRPDGEQVLAVLQEGLPLEDDDVSQPAVSKLAQRAEFVGRAAELAQLHRQFAESRASRSPACVFVHGESGIGKTMLVQRFVDDVASASDAVILDGRCFARESVPFKALDGVVDNLSRVLERWKAVEVAAVLPRDIDALSDMFPVLRRVEVIAQWSGRVVEDPVERRRLAVRALRDLLAAIADRRPLVIFVDDLQWGDSDSARVLSRLLTGSYRPALFFIGTFRTREADASPFLRSLDDVSARTAIELSPLSRAELTQLVQSQLAEDALPVWASTVAAACHGSAFLAQAMARFASAELAQGATPERIDLDQMLAAQLAALRPATLHLLHAVAVAGRPIPERVAAQAVGGDDGGRAFAELFAAGLVQRVATQTGHRVATLHDRVREIVSGMLDDAALRRVHGGLAEALESEPADAHEPEHLARHWLRAGEQERARPYAVRAGHRAMSVGAFDAAASHFSHAMALGGQENPLRIAHADALAYAGRCEEAARAYLDAASEVDTPAQVSLLRQHGASQLLFAGHVDEALALLRDVLAEFDIPLPERVHELEPPYDLASLDQRLRARKFAFEPRSEQDVDELTLRRVDACWSVAMGLATVETRDVPYIMLHLLLALECGEPTRILRGLGLMTCQVIGPVVSGDSRLLRRICQQAEQVAELVDSAAGRGWLAFTLGARDFWLGRATAAARSLAEAARALRSCRGLSREASMAELLYFYSRRLAGTESEVGAELEAFIAEARARGDLYAPAQTESWPMNLLARDEVDQAIETVDRCVAAWGRDAYDVPAFHASMFRSMVELYRGAPAAALEIIDAASSDFRRSGIAAGRLFRSLFVGLRGQAAMSTARLGGPDQDSYLERAEKDADEVASHALPCLAARAHLIRAGCARARGDAAAALEHLGAAREELADADANRLDAECAAWRYGELLGGEEGAAMQDEAVARLRDRGVVRPLRWIAMTA